MIALFGLIITIYSIKQTRISIRRTEICPPMVYNLGRFHRCIFAQCLFYSCLFFLIIGRCKCNGHASTCARNQQTGEHYCECDHNTAGKDCQRCLPLFNDRPWRRASRRSANPCKGMTLLILCVFL